MTQLKSRLPSISKPPEELFHDTTMKDRCFQVANEMRKNEMLTDITLVADDIKYPAHKFILATNSDYFLAMFNGPLSNNEQCLPLRGITAEALGIILNYIYTGIIKITEENVQSLLDASCLFLLMRLRNRCGKFLKDRLDVDNCLGIFSIAKSFCLQDLVDKSLQYIAISLIDLTNTAEFKQLSIDELLDIIDLDNLSIASEDDVIEAALSWLHYDTIVRSERFSDVLYKVHLPFASESLLQRLLECDEAIKDDEHLNTIVKSAISFPENPINPLAPKSWLVARKCVQCIPSVIAMGGPSLSIFNSELEEWVEITKCKPRHCPGMDVVGSFIYAVGGSLEWKRMSSGEKYNSETNEWISISNMASPRSNFGLVEHQGKLFAVGGYDGNFPLKTAEVYDPTLDRWSNIASLKFARDGACNVSDGERVYVIGGYNGSKYLTSVECYSEETMLWDTDNIPPLSVKRQNATSVYYSGRIYVIGGYFDDTYHKSVEVFDLETGLWSFAQELPEPRHHAGAAAINGHIFVCGGWSGQVPVSYVDVYSIEQDLWRRVAPLTTPTMMRCAAVNFPRKAMLNLIPQGNEELCSALQSKLSHHSLSSPRSILSSSGSSIDAVF